MPDTQWPRFEIFKQDAPGEPFRSVGSVHAADSELALLNARDVHVRRPDCVALWVVPAADIFARTAEELADEPIAASLEGGETRVYHVFQKTSQRRSMTYVSHIGEIQASSPEAALQQARHAFPSDDVFVWWVCPADAVLRSDAEDEPSWFAPARLKTYRQQAHYHHVERQARRREP